MHLISVTRVERLLFLSRIGPKSSWHCPRKKPPRFGGSISTDFLHPIQIGVQGNFRGKSWTISLSYYKPSRPNRQGANRPWPGLAWLGLAWLLISHLLYRYVGYTVLHIASSSCLCIFTPARTHSISELKSQILKLTFLAKEKWSRVFFFLFWNSLSPFRDSC